ncbi:MAG: DNA recombination/repair protein RecA, partial [Deltaproteobacteria bacterium]|nr:DNA recombination/repair protein RecA [Deltaproteobacteria bacterium]
IVTKSGAWYSYGDERMGQGRDNATNFMAETPEVFEEISTRLRTKLGLLPPAEDEPETPAQ